jgi:hypothetical protein
MSLKEGMGCGHKGCLSYPCEECDFIPPCKECGRLNGNYIYAAKGPLESDIHYAERMLQNLMRGMNIVGITLAFRTNHGTDVLTSVGTPPHLVMADDETWDEFIR